MIILRTDTVITLLKSLIPWSALKASWEWSCSRNNVPILLMGCIHPRSWGADTSVKHKVVKKENFK